MGTAAVTATNLFEALKMGYYVWKSSPTYHPDPTGSTAGGWTYCFPNGVYCRHGNAAGPFTLEGAPSSHEEVLRRVWGPKFALEPQKYEPMEYLRVCYYTTNNLPVPAGLHISDEAQSGKLQTLVLCAAALSAVTRIMGVLRAGYALVAGYLGLPGPRTESATVALLEEDISTLQQVSGGAQHYNDHAEKAYLRLASTLREAWAADMHHHPTYGLGQHMIRTCARMRGAFLSSGTKSRVEVVSCLFHGPAATGKDTTANDIAATLIERYGGSVYTAQSGQKYLDRWNDPFIVHVQDFLSSATPDVRALDCERFIGMNSAAPYRIEGADADEKGRFANHAFWFGTTNESHVRNKVPLPVRDTNAFWRRVSFQVLVRRDGTGTHMHLISVHPSTGLVVTGTEPEITASELAAMMISAYEHKKRVHELIQHRPLLPVAELPSFAVQTHRLPLLPHALTEAGAGAVTPPEPAAGDTAQMKWALVAGGVAIGAGVAAYALGWFDDPMTSLERRIRAMGKRLMGAGIAGAWDYVTSLWSYVTTYVSECASRVYQFVWENARMLGTTLAATIIVGLAVRMFRARDAPQAGQQWFYDQSTKGKRKHLRLALDVRFTKRALARAEAARSTVSGVLTKVSNNTVLLSIDIIGLPTATTHGTFLRPGTLVTAAHALLGPDTNSDADTGFARRGTLTFFHNSKRYSYALDTLDLYRSAGNSNDVAVVRVPDGPMVSDLSPHFIPADAHGGSFNGVLAGNPADIAVGPVTCGTTAEYDVVAGALVHTLRTEHVFVYSPEVTGPGVCGQLLVDRGSGSIMGMHISGGTVRACAVPLPGDVLGDMPQSGWNPIWPGGPVEDLSRFTVGTHDTYGGVNDLVECPGASVARAYGETCGVRLKVPSKLAWPRGSVQVQDVFKFPERKARAFQGVPDNVFELAASLVMPGGRFPSLTHGEAIDMMDGNKSPGLLWTAEGTQKKGDLMIEPGRTNLLAKIEALEGQVCDPDYRPLASVKLKSELISVASDGTAKMIRPIVAVSAEHNALLCATYRPLYDAMVAGRGELRTQVGVNPVSMEWSQLYTDFFVERPPGSVLATYDATRLDQHVPFDAVEHFARAAADRVWADRAVAVGVIEKLAHAWWVWDNTAYGAEAMNPSGNMFTVSINDYTMSLLYLVSLMEITGWTAERVVATCKWTTYGDDSLVVLPPGVGHSVLFAAARGHGIILTHADKLDHEDDYSVPPEEVTFLKRGFVPHDGCVLAPLEKRTILSSVAHRLAKDRAGVYYSQRVQCCLREASLWDEELFEAVRKSAAVSFEELEWSFCPDFEARPLPTFAECRRYMVACTREAPGAPTYVSIL